MQENGLNGIIINEERGIKICKTVINALENKKGLFADSKILEYMRPEGKLLEAINPNKGKDKEKKALWLFLTLHGDKSINSTQFYSQLKDFYLDHEDFFDLEKFIKLPYKEMNEILDYVKPLHWSEKFIVYMRENYVRLVEKVGLNPLNLFNEKDDGDSAIKKIKKFQGYNTAIASLLLIFYSKHNILKIPGIGPKVDRHLIKISESCEIYKRKGNPRFEHVSEKLFKIYKKIASDENLDAVVFNEGLWVIGSRLCVKKNLVYCTNLCPLDEYCSKKQPLIHKKNGRLYDKNNQRVQLALKFK